MATAYGFAERDVFELAHFALLGFEHLDALAQLLARGAALAEKSLLVLGREVGVHVVRDGHHVARVSSECAAEHVRAQDVLRARVRLA